MTARLKKYIPIFVLVLCFAFAAVSVSLSLDRNIELSAEAALKNACAVLINDAVRAACESTPGLADIVDAQKDEDGGISMINVKSETLNVFTLNAVEELQNAIEGLDDAEMFIPAGNVFMSRLFAGKGPMLRVHAYPLSACSVKYVSGFTGSGINQSLFRLHARVELEAAARVGIYTHSYTVTREVPVCEVIIVGKVPQTYANLTDMGDFLNLVP